MRFRSEVSPLLLIWGMLAASLLAPTPEAAEWEQGQGFRLKALAVPTGGKTGFTPLPAQATGITFQNLMPEQRHLTNQIYLNGSGVAAGDVDGDGRCDLYFCGLDTTNRLYRNLGDWKFTDITGTARVGCDGLDSTGAAFADLDGDGDLDLLVNSVGGGTRVFHNDGRGRFAEPAVLNAGKGGMSVALADIDGDGSLDVYVTNYRTSALMDIPNARVTFKTVHGRTYVERLDGRSTTSPDLTNRFSVTPRGRIIELGEADAFYRNVGGTNFKAISFTDGSFLDEDGKALTEPPFDWGLAAMFRDLNGDSLPDLYVCNDFDSVDRLWINQGGGRFRAVPKLAQRKASLFSMGVDFADINRDGYDDFLVLDMLSRDHRQRMTQMGDTNPSTPVIGEMENRPQYGLNTLFLNRGDNTFAEIGQLSGLDASEWSWTPIFLDVDLDGWEDLLISNGQERAARDSDVADRLRAMRTARRMTDAEIFQARRIFPRLNTPNLAFRNRHDLTFEEVSESWRFNAPGVSHGMALADLDNDGDLDVVINNFNALAGIYRNDTSAPRLAVRLRGKAPNTQGIGARINVSGGPVSQSQEVICGGRYLSCDEGLRVFAAGALTNRLSIEVLWRDGTRSVVSEVRPNCLCEIGPAAAEAVQSPKSKVHSPEATGRATNSASLSSRITHHASRITEDPLLSGLDSQPLFRDVSELIQHTHQEEPFDDFARQPLLPNRLSQLGPGVSWFDIDGNGWDDLIIGGGKGGQLAVYLNNGPGGFKRLQEPPLTQPVTRDHTTILGSTKRPGQNVLLVGSSNYEDGLALGSCVRQIELGSKTVNDSLAGRESSTGPLSLADLDGDGDLDLFVGGRVLPGKYPRPASSALYRNEAGKFEIDTENTRRLSELGLVSGAAFTDLDGDGDPDLILACEWGPVRIYLNERGSLKEWNPPVTVANAGATLNSQLQTLSQIQGWWNGVAAGDFDGDGRSDIVASNWGRNTPFEKHRSQPLLLFHGDLDGNGTEEIMEAYSDASLKKTVPLRQLGTVSAAIPFLRERFPTHQQYAEASIEEILGVHVNRTQMAQANWLESTIFLNRGDRFEARALPIEAQISPTFGVCVGDCDGDGSEDIFLSQNFFGAQLETPRYDGGRGLWLKGDGRGGFAALSGPGSGVKVYGEQRGCALSDFDQDGRIDLAVAQNGAATKVYRNLGAKPGLRVRLKGTEGNPHGIGASLRLIFGLRMGPVREVHAGRGYWSQDSPVHVMSMPEPPTRLWIRWPGGKTSEAEAPQSAREIEVDVNGRLTVVR